MSDTVSPDTECKASSPASLRQLKLAVTLLSLLVLGLGAITALLLLGVDLETPVMLLGATFLKPWLLAVLGGLIGGAARALYAFLVEELAFQVCRRHGVLPSLLRETLIGRRVVLGFDYMHVWYLYPVKPFIGAMLGFIFALLLKYNLIPFLVNGSPKTEAYGIVIVASIAGIFAEETLGFLSEVSTRRRQ